jgi:uncharacterized membrane protein (DUF485 family)
VKYNRGNAMSERITALRALANQRWRVALWLTGAMMFVYFGFILLVAFNKELMGKTLVPGLSIGILLGVLTIITAWVLIYVYVSWTNKNYDDQLASLRKRD